jgi:hypothetical protein
MSTAFTENAPSDSAAPISQGEPSTSSQAFQPLLWLVVIVVAGVVLRWWNLYEPFTLEEFATLDAVAERQGVKPGYLPAESDPLAPVSSWAEVGERSVMPYGITNPVPVYNYLLYAVVQVLPVNETTLRLPSLLAGLACVVAVYFLCRYLLGPEFALVAAFVVALEPMQVRTSVLAQPYALGNLACVLSFAALLGIFHARSRGGLLLATVGYGLSMALLGYLQPLLLLVAIAHAGVVLYQLFRRAPEFLPARDNAETPRQFKERWQALVKSVQATRAEVLSRTLYWLGGCALTALLLIPTLGYFLEVHSFYQAHREYLAQYAQSNIWGFVLHNCTFLLGLTVIVVVSYIAREVQKGGENEATATEAENGTEEGAAATGDSSASEAITAKPPPEIVKETPSVAPSAPASVPAPDNPELVWLGRVWLFLPQLLALVLAYGASQAIFVSPYLSYTTLGGAILLAYYATRDSSRDVRLGVTAALGAALVLWSLFTFRGLRVSDGFNLYTTSFSFLTPLALNDPVADPFFQRDDELKKPENRNLEQAVVLIQAGFPESDLLPDAIPEKNREHVRRAIASPYTTLYVAQESKPYIMLSKSMWRSDKLYTSTGKNYRPEHFYNQELAAEMRKYKQYLFVGEPLDRHYFLRCFLPWLADAVQWDLKVARKRDEEAKRYFYVPTDSAPDDYIEGLSDCTPADFPTPIGIRRYCPKGLFTLGAINAAAMPSGRLTVLLWLVGEKQTPRLTQPPDEVEDQGVLSPDRP